MKEKEKDPMIDVRKSSRSLKCLFTDQEKKEISETLALELEKCDNLKNEMKVVASDLKSKIAEKEGAIQKAAGHIRNGYEYRQVNVEVTKNFRMGTVAMVRLDTGELIEKRNMNAEERQMGFDLESKGKEDKKPGEPKKDGKDAPGKEPGKEAGPAE